MSRSEFDQLIGEELSAVTFVRDYIQLQFNPPPSLNALTPVDVRSALGAARLGETGFANLLVAQIGKHVRQVEFRERESLELIFDDDSQIALSLSPNDYRGPEALNLLTKNGTTLIV